MKAGHCLALLALVACGAEPATIHIECHSVPASDGISIQCGNDNSQTIAAGNATVPTDGGEGGSGGSGSGGAGGSKNGFYLCYQYKFYPTGVPCVIDADCPEPESPCVVRTCGASQLCVGNYAPLGSEFCGNTGFMCSGASCCGWLD